MTQIKEVKTKADLKKFVLFQFEIYKDNKYWVPPLLVEEYKYYQPKHNPAFQYNDVHYFVAEKDGKVVGRIGAIINHKYNEKTGKKYIRFSKPEFIDDIEVSRALIEKVEQLGREKGMELVHGPLGFSNLDTQGLLIDGFDSLQSTGSNYHLPYYKEHLENLGFEKETDWLEFILTLSNDVIKRGTKAAEIVKKRFGYEVPVFKTVKEIIPYGNQIFEIINEAFEHLPYVTKFDESLKNFYIKKYISVLDPRFFKLAIKGDEVIGFMIANPSMSKAFQKIKGKVYPFGFIELKKALKHNDTADFLLTGVKRKYQNSGVAVVLFAAIQETLFNNNMKYCAITGNIEDNLEAINNWKLFEHVQHKRRRCYVKKLI